MSKKRLLQTRGILKEQDTTVKPSGGFIQIGQPAFRTKGEGYIAKYANAEERQELAALAAKIEARRAKLPKFYYSICEKCGARTKSPYGDRDVIDPGIDYCLQCNVRREIGGGTMREMTKEGAKKYDADVAAHWKRIGEQTAKSNLFARNQKRQEGGLEPLTMKQFEAEGKRRWDQQREWDRGAPHKYYNSDAIEAEKKAEQEEAGAVTK